MSITLDPLVQILKDVNGILHQAKAILAQIQEVMEEEGLSEEELSEEEYLPKKKSRKEPFDA